MELFSSYLKHRGPFRKTGSAGACVLSPFCRPVGLNSAQHCLLFFFFFFCLGWRVYRKIEENAKNARPILLGS
jgi:hypothetical protein